MQFKLVTLALAALVASAAANNGTNSTHTSGAPPAPTDGTGAAVANIVSGGLLGGVVAAGLALVL